MNRLYLGYSESTTGGGICEGDEEEDWPDYNDSYVDFEPEGLYTKKSHAQCTLEVDFDPNNHINDFVYVVIVRYSDGDTFSQTNGNWHIEGVYLTKEEAKSVMSTINREKKKGPEYRPWHGYFASLESVEIWSTKILDEECSGIKWS